MTGGGCGGDSVCAGADEALVQFRLALEKVLLVEVVMQVVMVVVVIRVAEDVFVVVVVVQGVLHRRLVNHVKEVAVQFEAAVRRERERRE